MDIIETFTANGEPVTAEQLHEKLADHGGERYVIADGDEPLGVIVWDGKSDFTPERGTLVLEADWRGRAYAEPERPEAVTRRTRAQRIDALSERVSEDIMAWDALTAAQRTAATLRGLRLLRSVVRELRDDLGADE